MFEKILELRGQNISHILSLSKIIAIIRHWVWFLSTEKKTDTEEITGDIQKGIDEVKKSLDRLKQREKQIAKDTQQTETTYNVYVRSVILRRPRMSRRLAMLK